MAARLWKQHEGEEHARVLALKEAVTVLAEVAEASNPTKHFLYETAQQWLEAQLGTQVTIDGYTYRAYGDNNICVYRPRYGTLTAVLCVSQESTLQMACMSTPRVAWMVASYMASLRRQKIF